MANQLSMAKVKSIETLHASGHSNRQIAKLLGIHRETVNGYVNRLKAQNRPADEKAPIVENQPPENKAPIEETVTTGVASQCEPHRQWIIDKLDQGLSATRIHQDLKREHSFTGSYYSVRRFVAKLQNKTPLPFRRMEVSPGEEAQIDFGTGAPVITPEGKKRRPWMLRVILSHSRKGYSEVVWRQTTDNFIAAIENAFYYFGGVPKRLVIDNLKAAVNRADWYDPEIHSKLQSFAQHYGTAFVPTKAYTPEHKGKVESGVKYAKNNGLAGHTFESLEAQNDHLLKWEAEIADLRIHGTTKKQVKELFEAAERPALIELPRDRFANFKEARRSVSRDGHLEVDKAFYSAPPEYVGRRVWVRWDSRLVRVFNDQWKQLAIHSKCEPGRFRTSASHIPAEKVSSVERGTDALMRQIATIGPHTKAWSELVIAARGVQGVRVLVGLKSLAGKHPYSALEEACETAVNYGACRLKSIRNLLKRKPTDKQQQLQFIEEHPIIRPLSDYSIESINTFRKDRSTNQRKES
jgi:transposase